MADSGISAAQCQAILDSLLKAAEDGAGKNSITTDGITVNWATAAEFETQVRNWRRRLKIQNRVEGNPGAKRGRGTLYR